MLTLIPVFIGKYQSTTVAVKAGNNFISAEEFAQEADFQMKIPPHPNIVQLLGISTDGPQQLVVLEFCNGGSLDKLLFDSDAKISSMQLINFGCWNCQGPRPFTRKQYCSPRLGR